MTAACTYPTDPTATEAALPALFGPIFADPGEAGTPPPAAARILIVDDDAGIASLLEQMLVLLGHAPSVCTSPLEALDVVEQRHFDLVISDLHMPMMNGQQFYRLASLKQPALSDRFVFLTGDVQAEDTQAFLRSTTGRYLPKPFEFSSLATLLEESLAGTAERVAA